MPKCYLAYDAEAQGKEKHASISFNKLDQLNHLSPDSSFSLSILKFVFIVIWAHSCTLLLPLELISTLITTFNFFPLKNWPICAVKYALAYCECCKYFIHNNCGGDKKISLFSE